MGHKRGFVAVEAGQVHYRHVTEASGVPFVMLHGAPASSVSLVPLLEAMGTSRPVYAPDCPGMGDSTPLPHGATDLGVLADAFWKAMDALELDSIDLYGCLTGARIAVEMALIAPHRVRHLVLDAVYLLDDADRDEYIENYIPRLVPDRFGSQFSGTWNFCRDQYLFLPWYKTDGEHRRSVGLPAPELLHIKVLDVLKSLEILPAVLRSSLTYPIRERMQSLRVPTSGDASLASFIPGLSIMHAPMVEPLTSGPEQLAAKHAEIVAFLDGTSE